MYTLPYKNYMLVYECINTQMKFFLKIDKNALKILSSKMS